MNKRQRMIALYGGINPPKPTTKDIYDVVDSYRVSINMEISMGNMAGAIKAAKYLKTYLKRTKDRIESCQN